MEVLNEYSNYIFIKCAINVINQSDQPVPYRAGEDARFLKWTSKLVGLGQVRCRGFSEDRRTDKDITIYSVHD